MKYISTRGAAPALEFGDVLLTGLARDGGLYVPESWPRLTSDDIMAMAGMKYPDIVAKILEPFVKPHIDMATLQRMTQEAYADFGHAAVAPLKQLDQGLWLLELFHGPTLAFKDFALQLVGRMFDHVLGERGETVTVIGATSGDTGSAAIEACRDRDAVRIFMLHPHGRVSDVQRRQMTTVTAANVYNIAVEGTFDDCQDLVKAMFNDLEFRDETRMTAVNSINWARIMAQVAYYFAAAAALGVPRRQIAFSVPTGNFGNVYAGYAALAMGLPISQLVVASNRNDILTRFVETGTMSIAEVHPTMSPSMDIQVSSNFERLLFDIVDRDGGAVERMMLDFRRTGEMRLDEARMAEVRELFDGDRRDDAATAAAIRDIHRRCGELLDPHTAIGVVAALAKRRDPGVPMVALGTAHPAKFPDAVEAASGIRPELPERLSHIMQAEEHLSVLPNDLAAVQGHVRSSLGGNQLMDGAA